MKQLSILLIMLCLVQCKSPDDRYFKVYCWNNATAGSHLFIGKEDKGELPFLQEKEIPNKDSMYAQCLLIKLQSGHYNLVEKDQQGNIREKITLELYGSGGNSSILVKREINKGLNIHVIE